MWSGWCTSHLTTGAFYWSARPGGTRVIPPPSARRQAVEQNLRRREELVVLALGDRLRLEIDRHVGVELLVLEVPALRRDEADLRDPEDEARVDHRLPPHGGARAGDGRPDQLADSERLERVREDVRVGVV